MRDIALNWEFVARAPLRVGAGKELISLKSPVDLATIKISMGGRSTPYIPGSSIKGVFRSVSVQLARSKNIKVCDGVGENTCMTAGKQQGGQLKKAIDEYLRQGMTHEALKVFEENSCVLCKIFGSPGFLSHVHFMDAYPVGEPTTNVRVGIAIDRKTGAIWKKALYKVEYIEPGARFKAGLRATNLPNYAIGLLVKILRLADQGYVRIGGFKTRGFGLVGVDNIELAINDPEAKGLKLRPLDKFDSQVDLEDCASLENGRITVRGDRAKACLEKLERVWESARLGKDS
ncbi:type III CRISPR-associated RAMP protein Csx7 [Thermosphaera sp.]